MMLAFLGQSCVFLPNLLVIAIAKLMLVALCWLDFSAQPHGSLVSHVHLKNIMFCLCGPMLTYAYYSSS
jgi:hypothetical protein